MRRLLVPAAVVAAVLLAAACGGSVSNGTSAGPPAPGTGAATVSAKQIGGTGMVLVDPAGQALYANDQEAGGTVLCTGACTSFWTPLTISGGNPTGGGSLTGKLGVVERPDGTKQVTYNGKLLYSFYQDQPGQVTGEGFVDAFGGQQLTWHVIHNSNTGSSTGSGTSSPAGSPAY